MVKPSAEDRGTSAERTIMLVDDTPLVLVMYGRYLEDEGFQVVTAASGPEALEQLKTVRPDVIVLDYMMPHMTGHELLAELRRGDATRATPVLFLTSVGDDEEVISKALSLGADAYIEKPSPQGLFIEMVRSLIN